MVRITSSEFQRIADALRAERDSIVRHNPIGTPDESMLWMLLGCLVSYLSISDSESPCFTGRPDAESYRNAISYVLEGRVADNFDLNAALDGYLIE